MESKKNQSTTDLSNLANQIVEGLTAKTTQRPAKKTFKQIAGNKEKGYKFPENEADFVHVEIGKKQFSPTTGEKLSKNYIQKFDPRSWKTFLRHPNGLAVEKILHLPEGATTPEAVAAEKEAKRKKAIETARKSLGLELPKRG
jgi:hypothetical protein